MAVAPDIRPWHADLDALLASASMTVETRRRLSMRSEPVCFGAALPLPATRSDRKGAC
jgi:hypothetical protein